MANKKRRKKYWLIPLIIGISLGVFGITKLAKAMNMIIPPMGEPDWFTATAERSSLITEGGLLGFFGFVVIGMVGTIITFFATRSPEDEADSVHRQVMKEKRYKDRLKENGTLSTAKEMHLTDEDLGLEDFRPKKVRYCPYCGTEMEANERVCPSCNARIRK